MLLKKKDLTRFLKVAKRFKATDVKIVIDGPGIGLWAYNVYGGRYVSLMDFSPDVVGDKGKLEFVTNIFCLDAVRTLKDKVFQVLVVDGVVKIGGVALRKINITFPDTEFILSKQGVIRKWEDLVRISPFAGTDMTRSFMNGFYFDIDRDTVVTTNGRSLGLVSNAFDGVPEGNSFIMGFRDGLLDCGFNGKVEFGVMNESRYFTDGKLTFIGKEVDGNYPNYGRVVPHEKGATVYVSGEEVDHAFRSLKEKMELSISSTLNKDKIFFDFSTPGKVKGWGYKVVLKDGDWVTEPTEVVGEVDFPTIPDNRFFSAGTWFDIFKDKTKTYEICTPKIENGPGLIKSGFISFVLMPLRR